MQKRTLIGMLTPSSNTVLEPVTSAMLAGLPEVTAHFGRFRVTEISLNPQALGQFDNAPFLDAARTNRRYAFATFGTAPGHLEASLRNIIEEKYVTLFLNPEIWNDWKRTCLPSLAPAPGATAIPSRLAYSDHGANTPTVSSVGVPITSTSRNPNQPAACPSLNYTNSEPLAN